MINLLAILIATTPATLTADLARAAPGDTVQLAAGDYPALVLKARSFAPPLTINAAGARVGYVSLTDVAGVNWTGGSITSGDPLGYGFLIRRGNGVGITRVAFRGVKRGVVFDHSAGGSVTRSLFEELSVDGVDIAQSQRIEVGYNVFYSNSTGLVHPDAVQGWSRPDMITGSVRVHHNLISGAVQGVSFFNHTDRGRTATFPGIDDGGFDGPMEIDHNVVANSYPQGIAISNVRGVLAVHDNQVWSLPGAAHKTSINGPPVGLCGNAVLDVANSPAAVACPAN